MAHIVTCQICHKKFDRDKEPFKKIASRKYVHQSCYDSANKDETEIIQDQKDSDELFKYCEKLVGKEKFNFLATQKYFQKLKSDPDKIYTYTGMLRTLHWYYEVKGHTPDESAVGIIPYAYDDANRYYYNEVNWGQNTFYKKLQGIVDEKEQYLKLLDEYEKEYL